MWLSRTPILLVVSACFSVIYALFSIKNGVMTMRTELVEVKKQIRQESNAMRILKAEFSYLTSPIRLQKLNSKYLQLRQTSVAQMVRDPSCKQIEIKPKLMASNYSKNMSNNKWRYKKGVSKYLTLVSGKR